MKEILAQVGWSPQLVMKIFHKSHQDPNPKRVNQGLEAALPGKKGLPGLAAVVM